MTVQQLSVLKQWQVAHREQQPLEFHAWDAVLTLWLLGWAGIPAAALLGQPLLVVLCFALIPAPRLYVRWRRHLHTLGRMRCDWLGDAPT